MMGTVINNFLTKSLPSLHIAVIGDVMVDRYIYGKVERISPEAPVPVNKVERMQSTLGGAANVASNLANLNCQVYLGGLVGDDEHQATLLDLLGQEQIDAAGLIIRPGHITTTKLRILGARQQMIRVDFEEITPVDEAEVERLTAWLAELRKNRLDGIVLSDYGKGLVTPELSQAVIQLANDWQIPILVDPKGNDWTKYYGATFVTPNLKELSECIGQALPNEDEPIVSVALILCERYGLTNLAVTRSEKGISMVNHAGKVWHSPAAAQDVFDVSGAGDTVAAMLIASAAGGLSIRMGMQAANQAAGVVVAKVGTYPIHRTELVELWQKLHELRWKPYEPLTVKTMAHKIRRWQDKGETVVFTNGCFDILHRGHIVYLQQAAMLGDHLVVGINSDDSVRRLKGAMRPLVGEQDRAMLLSALSCIDDVVLFSEDTPKKLLEQLRPDVLVKGGDYRKEEVIGKESVKRVEILPFEAGYSTTNIVEKIADLVKENAL